LLIGFTNIVFGCCAARNDRLQKYFVLRFDERHQVRIPLNQNHGNLLPGITLLIRMLEEINLVARLNVKHHILER